MQFVNWLVNIFIALLRRPSTGLVVPVSISWQSLRRQYNTVDDNTMRHIWKYSVCQNFSRKLYSLYHSPGKPHLVECDWLLIYRDPLLHDIAPHLLNKVIKCVPVLELTKDAPVTRKYREWTVLTKRKITQSIRRPLCWLEAFQLPTYLITGWSEIWDVHWIKMHYGDVIMGAIASQITSLTIVYSTVYSDADERKHQNSASLAFVRGIHRRPVNSPHKWPVTRKMFPLDDVIMGCQISYLNYNEWND